MRYYRYRSDFWITAYINSDSSFVASTSGKYIAIVNYFFPYLETNSPTKWKKNEKYEDTYTLRIPDGYYDPDTITRFADWCETAVNNMLWLGLNKNIEKYFCNELDYCIASDFNMVYGNGRTAIGEAEYQLKYNRLDRANRIKYFDMIIESMLAVCDYLPFYNGCDWCVSPLPASREGKAKLAWHMAEEISTRMDIFFINPSLVYDKPQMKQLSIEEKFKTWENIYRQNGVVLDQAIRGKGILIVDDLYQSGITMWEYARFLKTQGAQYVFGIVCVKSLRDSDNR